MKGRETRKHLSSFAFGLQVRSISALRSLRALRETVFFHAELAEGAEGTRRYRECVFAGFRLRYIVLQLRRIVVEYRRCVRSLVDPRKSLVP